MCDGCGRVDEWVDRVVRGGIGVRGCLMMGAGCSDKHQIVPIGGVTLGILYAASVVFHLMFSNTRSWVGADE